jgi:hypothetical protein
MPASLLRSLVPQLLKSVFKITKSAYRFDGSDRIFALLAVSSEHILIFRGRGVWGQFSIVGGRGLDPGLLALRRRLAVLLWVSWMQAVGYERVSLQIVLHHWGKESYIHTADIY